MGGSQPKLNCKRIYKTKNRVSFKAQHLTNSLNFSIFEAQIFSLKSIYFHFDTKLVLEKGLNIVPPICPKQGK